MRLRTRRFRNERLVVLFGLGVASALCVALEAFRELRYEAFGYRFLLWNLFLAWIPLVLALFAYDRYRQRARVVGLLPVLALWLLFLPNAPYIVTDFVHLSESPATPLWLDGLTLSAFAWTGMLLGFVSLHLVHAILRHRLGGMLAWTAVLATLPLVSAGIYLGRFKHWNSWDLLVRPGVRLGELHGRVTDPGAIAHAAGATAALTLLLALAYLVFYALVGTGIGARAAPSRD